ncbi:DUF1127 domain-containing protein [Microvirga sp. VF16]|uniref:DUF1127 domain-containing protein n=1 Tax=Microvirga sp. VF16 TaxID=2807101 RepID=UPI00193EAC5E|nr:DUF1127 domain-containing protein [Microvirga sp. VF16]QRM28486.1 DUF1127 domain-containing protein [Microvirga sp. VF16]
MNRSALSTMTFSGMATLGVFTRALSNLVKALQHRREVKNLAEFDDRMLADIGLTRSDVTSALDEPLTRNPSWVLVRNAERHSRAERPDQSAQPVRPVVPMVTPLKRCA